MVLAMLLALTLLPSANSQTLSDPPKFEPRLFPEFPNERDKRYIGFYDTCGESPILEPVRLVSDAVGSYRLDLRLAEDVWQAAYMQQPLSFRPVIRMPN